MSQPQVAERLAVRPTALSNWENGARDISLDSATIDRALAADGVLAGLLWAFGTPEGLAAGRVWSKVFPGPSRPVWMWVRSNEPGIRIEGEWGVFRVEGEFDIGPNGVFVTVGGSVSESPVVVQLSRPGWVDFGWGDLPMQVPGATVLTALDVAQPSTASGAFMDLFSHTMAEGFDKSRPREIRNLARRSPLMVSSFFNGFSQPRPRPVTGPWPPVPDVVTPTSRLQYARLRSARNLSLVETTERLIAETGISVGKDTLRRFENGQGEPQDRSLPAALDHVLGAEGHLAIAEVRSGQGPGTVHFPRYWAAPVWFAFDGPGNDGIELQWGAWRRRIESELPLLVISHYAEPQSPLRILTGRWTRWTAGVGRRPGAVPINHGWVPISMEEAQRAITDTEDAVLDAMRRREEKETGFRTGFDTA
jgi:transcriptional regulator with XRE-family HTH domain